MADSGLDILIKKLDDCLVDPSVALSANDKTQLLQAFCRVKNPEDRHVMDFITIHSGGRKGGVSTKPGNITLNWRVLFGALPGMAITAVGGAANPWLLVLGALVIWKDLYATTKVELEPPHAIAMNVMWNNHDGKQRIPEEKARSLTNEALAEFNLNQVNEGNFVKIIDDLSIAGCIELSDGEIWLREWIRRSWP